jgi:hypothetical protein
MTSPDPFEYFLIVQLDTNKEPLQPVITFQFPDKITENVITSKIPQFCFPEATELLKSEFGDNQEKIVETFSFVITAVDGSKRYAYCRRYIFQSKSIKPECLCLVSTCSSFSLFSQILDIVELKREAEGTKSVFRLLNAILAQPFPHPGDTIIVKTFSLDAAKNDGQIKSEIYRLTRSDNDYEYLEYVTFDPLFHTMSLEQILYIFECVLLEKKLIVCAKHLDTLTACVNAISALVYPFYWQCVFVPLLPESLINFVCAPMPFLVGILKSSLPQVDKQSMEEDVLLIDLDEAKFLRQPPEDQVGFIPPYLRASLEKNLGKVIKSGRRGMEFNILVAHSFLRFFSEIFGDYPKFFKAKENDNPDAPPSTPRLHFHMKKFIRSKTSEVKRFLDQFKTMQMWEVFIHEREEMAERDNLGYCALLRTSEAELKKKIQVAGRCTKCGKRMVDKKGEYVCPRCDLGEKKNVASTIRKKLNQFFQIEEKEKDKDKPEARERRETVTSVNNNNQLTPPTTSDDRSVSSVDDEESVSSPRRGSDPSQPSSSASTLTSSKKHLPPLPLPKKKDKEKDKPVKEKSKAEKDDTGKPPVPPKSNRKSMVISAQKIRNLFTPRGKDKGSSPPQLDLTRVEKSSLSPSDDEDSMSGSARRSFSGSDDPESSSHYSMGSNVPSKAVKLLGSGSSRSKSASPGQSNTSMAVNLNYSGSKLLSSRPSPKWREQLALLYNNSTYSDVVLQSTDRVEFHAYKPLLVARFPKFAMFFKPRDGKFLGKVHVPIPLHSAIIESLLTYLVKDRFLFDRLQEEHYFELLEFIDTDLPTYRKYCLVAIKRKMSPRTFINFLDICHLKREAHTKTPREFPAGNHVTSIFNMCKLYFAKNQTLILEKVAANVLTSKLPIEFVLESLKLQGDGLEMDRIERQFEDVDRQLDNTLRESMKALLSSGDNFDFVINFNSGQKVNTHSGILSVRSGVFNNMFHSGASGPLVVKHEMNISESISSHEAFQHFMHFLYTDSFDTSALKLDLNSENSQRLISEIGHLGTYFDVDKVTFQQALLSIVVSHVTTANIFELLSIKAPSSTPSLLPAMRVSRSDLTGVIEVATSSPDLSRQDIPGLTVTRSEGTLDEDVNEGVRPTSRSVCEPSAPSWLASDSSDNSKSEAASAQTTPRNSVSIPISVVKVSSGGSQNVLRLPSQPSKFPASRLVFGREMIINAAWTYARDHLQEITEGKQINGASSDSLLQLLKFAVEENAKLRQKLLDDDVE